MSLHHSFLGPDVATFLKPGVPQQRFLGEVRTGLDELLEVVVFVLLLFAEPADYLQFHM